MKRIFGIFALLLTFGLGTGESLGAPSAAVPWTDLKIEKMVPIQNSSIAGTGPIPVIIIGDLGSNESAYADFAKRHAERFTTHTLVLPGTSANSRPPTLERGQVKDPYYLVNAVNAILAYAKEHKLEKTVVIGHGEGGTVAYMLAAKQPDFASAYVVLNAIPAMSVGEPGNIPSKEERPSQVDKLERQTLLAMNQNAWMNRIRLVVPGQTTSRARADALVNMMSAAPAQVVRRYMLEALYLDLRDDLASSPAPILLYLTRPSWMQETDKQIIKATFQNAVIARPDSRLEVLDGARQWVIVDEPAKFDPPLLKFLGIASDDAAVPPVEAKPAETIETKPEPGKK